MTKEKKKKQDATQHDMPDFRHTHKDDAGKGTFPAEVDSEYRIHISRGAYDEMKDHAAMTDQVELCGVLVGDVCRDDQGFFLKVTGAIRGEGANNYGSQVTFTHETWNHINSIKDEKYPHQKVVGWYHTHPGFGVFLSKMDSFIQENFFNQPYQIAIVLETKDNEEGCFAWKDGRSAALKRYWVDDEEIDLKAGSVTDFDGDPVTAEKDDDASNNDDAPRSPRRRFDSMPGCSSVLFAALTLVLGWLAGQMYVVHTLRNDIERSMESEVYSFMEFAAVNQVAFQDMNTVREELENIHAKADETGLEGTKESIDALALQVETLQNAYARQGLRAAFRQDMADLIKSKQHLADRVHDNTARHDEMQGYVATLYLLRLQEALAMVGTDDPAEMSESARELVKQRLDLTLEIDPSMKGLLKQNFPTMLEYFYPDQYNKSSTKTRDTDEGEGEE
jgi:proteasome lid subunit RPN8/RPN11